MALSRAEQELLDSRVRMMLRMKMGSPNHRWTPDRDGTCLLCRPTALFRHSRLGHIYVIFEEP